MAALCVVVIMLYWVLMMMLTNDDADAGHTPIRGGFVVSVTFAINKTRGKVAN